MDVSYSRRVSLTNVLLSDVGKEQSPLGLVVGDSERVVDQLPSGGDAGATSDKEGVVNGAGLVLVLDHRSLHEHLVTLLDGAEPLGDTTLGVALDDKVEATLLGRWGCGGIRADSRLAVVLLDAVGVVGRTNEEACGNSQTRCLVGSTIANEGEAVVGSVVVDPLNRGKLKRGPRISSETGVGRGVLSPKSGVLVDVDWLSVRLV